MRKRKVLVVDDENFIRELIYDFLEFENIECDKAESQEVALELISKNDYDLILLDRNLKDFKSENMIEKIKKDIPIVLLTGEDGACEDYFRELGISEIIFKPFQYDDFMNKINPYLRFK